MDTTSPITQLTVEETLAFLSDKNFGRLAISLDGKPDIFPINFAVHVNDVDDVVAYIRTSPGNKLFATATGGYLALETDRIEGNSATSAVIYGTGRQVEHRKELELVDTLGLEAWVAVRKPDVIAIDIDHISGRRFTLGPGPETTIAEAPD
ncbi:pyridoxamine 5'-phosphate oxidase family protein [Enteractinococcus coprophilus]|uniref:Nitroimidazol reductase NimA-like FMN-containing flavoprotein (Pyridoxamine 5'-phosphate oxidase superfamily) n=1 Tax=Enteractinococcus coprophilus TaxID=1027633 RepID=A0A543AIH8_9MICC|nr:pyridoxamine 5'-phosphate oxidase family protein [Enteractinococcus coprophilus]TQL72382.1 nitroimidazol reductase NimA-like FMN-containing flavoprotein (pyridoxamine 5'-phosphate oxidase superfamily) [Enteractinococcus coprophilus]